MAALVIKHVKENISSTTDVVTLDMKNDSFLSYQANIAGSLTGVLQLWVSNDKVNFVERTDAAKLISASGSYLVEIVTPCIARYYKIVMYVGAGTGDVEVITCVKGDA